MDSFIKTIAPYNKAVVAFLVGILQFASLYFSLTTDNNLSGEDIQALINNVILALGGTAGVYYVRNQK